VSAFEEREGRVLSRERLQRGATEFAALSRQVIAAAADAVVYEGLDPEGALLLRDLRGEGFEGLFVGPDSLLNEEDFIGTSGSAAEDAVLTAGPVADSDFNERYEARFGRAPGTSFVLQAYDAARLTLTAIETVAVAEDGGVVIDRDSLADVLRGSAFAGLTGTIRFGESGDRTGESARELGLAIFRVSDGLFEQVE
jgi:branched-chain amino acid transport system substrate-binding protein